MKHSDPLAPNQAAVQPSNQTNRIKGHVPTESNAIKACISHCTQRLTVKTLSGQHTGGTLLPWHVPERAPICASTCPLRYASTLSSATAKLGLGCAPKL